ncbi:MAG: hypothetical protein M3O91_08580 [Chloroflexota bacterium]|nr:hypothetical protein [Chloroflexota bacterium]
MRNQALVLATTMAFFASACAARPSAPAAIVDEPSQEVAAAEQAPVGAVVIEPSMPSVVAAPPATTAEPAPAVGAPGSRADVASVSHVWQSLNNCGPASVVMALAAFGISVSQEAARLSLRGPDIRRGMPSANVDPWVREQFGLRAIARTNGTNDLMKRLVTNGFTPIVTQWLEDPSRIAHDRLVRGYDDSLSAFLVNDPMRGAAVPLSYSWFATNWQTFNYGYFVIYRPEDEPVLRAIIGDEWNDRRMRERMYERAKVEARDQDSAAASLFYGEAAYRFGMFAEAVAAFEAGTARGSPAGVFTVRSSYPLALRALGRDTDSDEAVRRLANTSPTPFDRPAAIDALALTLAAERAAAAIPPTTVIPSE